MDDSVSLDDLVDQLPHFVLVHRPNLIESVLIRLFETLELVLQLLELLSELLVVLSQLDVLLLIVLALSLKLVLDSSEDVSVPSVLVLQTTDCVGVNLFSLLQDFVVELKLFLVESVDSLHIFHALLENLHFLFKLDLLLCLVISVLGSKVFELLSVVLFVISSLSLEVLL